MAKSVRDLQTVGFTKREAEIHLLRNECEEAKQSFRFSKRTQISMMATALEIVTANTRLWGEVREFLLEIYPEYFERETAQGR